MRRKTEIPVITDLPPKKQERKSRREKIVRNAKYVGVLAAAAVTASIVARKEAKKTVNDVQFEFQLINEETGELAGTIKSTPPEK